MPSKIARVTGHKRVIKSDPLMTNTLATSHGTRWLCSGGKTRRTHFINLRLRLRPGHALSGSREGDEGVGRLYVDRSSILNQAHVCCTKHRAVDKEQIS